MIKTKIAYFLLLAGLGCSTYLSLSCQSHPSVHRQILYENFCANCHMEDGTGLPGNIPPLAGADFLKKYANALPCIILYGIQDTMMVNGKEYTTPMAGVPQLTDVEVTNVINYINHAWGNNNGFTRPTDVQVILEGCK